MIAVIKTGGKQYAVSEGEILKIEKIEGEVDASVKLDSVLLRSNDSGSDCTIGSPFIEGASVTAKILEQGRGEKINIIKYKPKVRYRRKNGHRQLFTKVQITLI